MRANDDQELRDHAHQSDAMDAGGRDCRGRCPAGDDEQRERRERLVARIVWGVNLFGLLLLLAVFLRLDGFL